MDKEIEMNKTNLQGSGSKTPLRIIFALVAIVILTVSASGSPALAQKSQAAALPAGLATVTDQWAVQIVPGTDPDALAAQLGAVNLGQVGTLTGYYVFRKPGTDSDATAMADAFAASSQVLWYEQQVARQLSSRAFTPPTDPLYASQWHLVNANVPAAWALGPTDAGYTGSGVTIGIVDDGLQYTHPDLSAPKYVAAASWDFNGNDAFPLPVKTTDYHGTAVAGVAAANNDGVYCGVGVAYGANLAGLRLISDPVTDAQQAAALTHNYIAPNMISIYNNSWGPVDDGSTLQGPGALTLAALENGVTLGRAGKGSIYVWSAGNGLQVLDNVNYDGYANSRFGIAVGAVDSTGVQTAYSEPGAAMFVTAPSSPTIFGGIVTTDLMGTAGYNASASPTGDCTNTGFGGTSSSAPVVSGVVALMLQANPNLGWRDVQHILALTAINNNPLEGWGMNGVGFHVNHKYGFGLVDAATAVAMAKTWVNVGPEISVTSGIISVNQAIPDLDPVTGVTSTVDITDDIQLEHVEVVFKATHPFRGDLKVVLTAPSGIKSILADRHDDRNPNYSSWTFMTVRDWGESSKGTWSLQVTDLRGADVGTFDNWELILYGTTPVNRTISGNVGVEGAFLNYTNGTAQTAYSDASGNYSFTVPNEWAGTVTPTVACRTFSPSSTTYGHIFADQTAQDYTPTLTADPTCITRSISGVVTSLAGPPIVGALVKTNLGYIAITDVNGNYSISGLLPATTLTVTASMADFITGSQEVTLPPDGTGVNFVLMPSNTSVTVMVGGSLKGSYVLLPSRSMRVNYPGLNSGPVKVESTNGVPIIAAIRDSWWDGTAWSSFSQLMGLPAGQVSDTYVFPAYNNVSLDEQLRFGNVGVASTTVTVTIGGVVRGTYDLAPNQSWRVNYAGLNSGPVVVKSSGGVPIIAALRDSWWDGVKWSSFVQTMGLPISQVSDTYLFPAYNNVYLDEQLRFGNVGVASTTVTVTIAGVVRGTYDLAPNESWRVNYPGLNSGPVVVKSSGGVPIIAAIRDSWWDGTRWSDYSQLMGLPVLSGQVLDTYLFPAYNNVSLDEQLRFGNIGVASTTVTVTIAGVVRGMYDLAPNESWRVNYAGLNSGPVVVKSSGGVPIIAAIRDSWWDGTVWSSFVQTMGLPASQVSNTYLFPAYNNVTLDEQLRFGVP
jgi:subtilisin-like proprotein convertase family protein